MGKVKFLKHGEIEGAALCLLADYGRRYGALVVPPRKTLFLIHSQPGPDTNENDEGNNG